MAGLLGVAAVASLQAADRSIDLQHSSVTVHVGKAGLFSAFAHDHVIGAPISMGTISEAPPLEIKLAFRTTDLTVLDADVDSRERAEVRARMLGPDVLEAARFPEITFESTEIQPRGSEAWTVSGRLMIRGITRVVTFSVGRVEGRYHGEVRIKQRDFGIEPIRIAGGAVTVRDELKIQFDIAAMSAPSADRR